MHELAEQAGIELPRVLAPLNRTAKTRYVETKPDKKAPVVSTRGDLKHDSKNA